MSRLRSSRGGTPPPCSLSYRSYLTHSPRVDLRAIPHRLLHSPAPPLLFTSLHTAQCTWGRETAKKARTQQHFESLVNHIKSLESRVKELETDLARAQGRSSSLSDSGGAAGSSSLSPQPSPAHQVAKYEDEEDAHVPNGATGIDDGDEEGRGRGRGKDSKASESDEDSEIEQLIAPTRHLVVHPNQALICSEAPFKRRCKTALQR